jgi:hypothetical protein
MNMTQTTRTLNRSQTNLATEAEKAVRRGFSLIPLNGKRPILDNWTSIPDVVLARAIGLLHDGERTVDEEAQALLLDLARAGSPRRGTAAFDRWLKQHPEFVGRVAAVEDALTNAVLDEAAQN